MLFIRLCFNSSHAVALLCDRLFDERGIHAQFDVFYKKLKENGKDTPLACDCELMALCSRRDFRKGLGTALWEAFKERCIQSGVKMVRLFTDTDATYTFYEKRGFRLVWEKPYSFGTPGRSLVYEYPFSARRCLSRRCMKLL